MREFCHRHHRAVLNNSNELIVIISLLKIYFIKKYISLIVNASLKYIKDLLYEYCFERISFDESY